MGKKLKNRNTVCWYSDGSCFNNIFKIEEGDEESNDAQSNGTQPIFDAWTYLIEIVKVYSTHVVLVYVFWYNIGDYKWKNLPKWVWRFHEDI